MLLDDDLASQRKIESKISAKIYLCVDCPENIIEYVKKNSVYPVYSFWKLFSLYIESEDRMLLAKTVLFTYQNAHCVITTNLHTAIPCLAFNTSVCLLTKENKEAYARGRFDGMENMFNQAKQEEFLTGKYNFIDPPKNPTEYLKHRDALVEKSEQFTGYDSQKPTLDDDFEPLFTLISIIQENHNNVRRVLYFAKKRELLRMLILKLFKKVDKNDIDSDKYLSFRKKK